MAPTPISALFGISGGKEIRVLRSKRLLIEFSVFWHQTNTHRVSALSHFFVHDVLRFPRGNKVVSYLRAFTTLFVSGVQHLVIDLSAGVSMKDSGAIRFFCTQLVGILIEDVVIASWRKYEGHQSGVGVKGSQNHNTPLWQRTIGIIWVAVFLTWSTPSYLYPLMYRAKMGYADSTVPWSVVIMMEKG
jgi:hypothetical protein